MEFNFRKELSQQHRLFYIGKLPLNKIFPSGLTIGRAVVFFVSIVGAFAPLIFGWMTANSKITEFYSNTFLYIFVLIGLITWILFGLSWDNKNFLDFMLGRSKYMVSKGKEYAQGEIVYYSEDEEFGYEPIIRGIRRETFKEK